MEEIEPNADRPPAPATGVPIGTILAYIGSLAPLPRDWQLCDGKLVTDVNSPFNGQHLPNLTDERFLMGVSAATRVSISAGSNTLQTDGQHTHPISWSKYAPGEINYNHNQGHQSPFQMQYASAAAGNHNHGGDKKPAHLSVYFIIKIK